MNVTEFQRILLRVETKFALEDLDQDRVPMLVDTGQPDVTPTYDQVVEAVGFDPQR